MKIRISRTIENHFDIELDELLERSQTERDSLDLFTAIGVAVCNLTSDNGFSFDEEAGRPESEDITWTLVKPEAKKA